MDPLSALGLAAAVVQFASFAGSILSNAAEVYSSTTCASNEVVSLEQIYLRLREFSSTLGAAYQRAAGANRPEIKVKQKLPGDFNSTMQHSKQFEDDSFDTNCSLGDLGPQVPGLKDSYSSLATLLSSCHTDCHKIMAIVQRLKDKSDNKSRWSCFKVALKTAWHRDEIAELETRLQKTQQLVLLEMNQLAQ
jgi:hypothetical protein